MRDRDMADVIVTGSGVWERESDVHIRDLIEREDEEERAWRERHAAELAVPGNKLRPPRRASKGHRLTEQNVKIWLTLVCTRLPSLFLFDCTASVPVYLCVPSPLFLPSNRILKNPMHG